MRQENKILKNDQIDFWESIILIFKNKKIIFKILILSLIIGIIYAFSQKERFKSFSTFYPHFENVNNNANLRNLAGLAGINLNSEISTNMPTSIYPKLIRSTSFKKNLLNSLIITNNKEISFREYLINKKSFSLFNNFFNSKNKVFDKSNVEDKSINNLNVISNSDYKLFKVIDNNINLNLNEDNGFIELIVYDENPEVSTQIAIIAQKKLQESIINFKIKNIEEVFKFTIKQLGIAKKNFYQIQDSLANFRDSNKNIKSDIFKNKLNRLETEYNLSKNIYNELAITKEKIAIDVRKNTPIFTIINEPVVPNERSEPNKTLIIFIFILIGIGISFIWIFLKDFIIKLINFLK